MGHTCDLVVVSCHLVCPCANFAEWAPFRFPEGQHDLVEPYDSGICSKRVSAAPLANLRHACARLPATRRLRLLVVSCTPFLSYICLSLKIDSPPFVYPNHLIPALRPRLTLAVLVSPTVTQGKPALSLFPFKAAFKASNSGSGISAPQRYAPYLDWHRPRFIPLKTAAATSTANYRWLHAALLVLLFQISRPAASWTVDISTCRRTSAPLVFLQNALFPLRFSPWLELLYSLSFPCSAFLL